MTYIEANACKYSLNSISSLIRLTMRLRVSALLLLRIVTSRPRDSVCRRSVLPPAGYVMEDCVHRCPELDACINSSLWCDGVAHCPSGYDEAAKHCSFLLQFPPLYLALGAAAILAACCSLCLITCGACRRRRRSRLHRRIKSLPSEASTIGKEVIC
jgi:hypothetical protein